MLSGLSPAARDQLEVAYLPAPLHNRPERIAAAVAGELDRRRRSGDGFCRVLLGYGDCGTGGALDRLIEEWTRAHPDRPMARLQGEHCYAFFAGPATFDRLHGEELGTFFLTDFMVVNFDSLIWQGLGLDQHSELRAQYFGNSTRALYLAQAPTAARITAARSAAARLGLRFEHHTTGLAPFRSQLSDLLVAG